MALTGATVSSCAEARACIIKPPETRTILAAVSLTFSTEILTNFLFSKVETLTFSTKIFMIFLFTKDRFLTSSLFAAARFDLSYFVRGRQRQVFRLGFSMVNLTVLGLADQRFVSLETRSDQIW